MRRGPDVLVAEPSWRGHTLVFAAMIANQIRETGRHVRLLVPELTDENRDQIDVARELAHDEIDLRTGLRAFSSGFGRIFSKDSELVADSVLDAYEESGAKRLVLPTADAIASMKPGTSQAAKMRSHQPRSVVHQPRLGYGGFGIRFAMGREIMRSRMRRCGHHILTLDPLTHRSAIKAGLDMGLVSFSTVKDTEMNGSEARDLLEIPEKTRVISLLGEHSARKGSLEVIQAWPKNTDQDTTLLIMGSLSDSIRNELARRHDQVSSGRITVHDGFVSNKIFQAGFMASDVVTTLYPRHHGISGVTEEAALYRRPVLGGDHGANGTTIRQYGLGETIDATSPSQLRDALIKVLKQNPVVDQGRREDFIFQRHPDRIAEVVNTWIGLQDPA